MSTIPVHSDSGQFQQRNSELSILIAFTEALNRSVDLGGALYMALSKAGEIFVLQATPLLLPE